MSQLSIRRLDSAAPGFDGELAALTMFEAAQDPAVQAGRLILEWHSWYSAEGITIVPGKSPPQKP